jgi:hypothetical protein
MLVGPPEASLRGRARDFGGGGVGGPQYNPPYAFGKDVLAPQMTDRWWYWYSWSLTMLGNSTSPGPAISVGNGMSNPGIEFRNDFMTWSNDDWFRNKFKVSYFLHPVPAPALILGQVQGPGYGWGEFVVPIADDFIGLPYLKMDAAQFQALAVTFYGGTDGAKVDWELSNGPSGSDPIQGQTEPMGTTPIMPPPFGGVTISTGARFRLFRGQQQAQPIYIRFRSFDTSAPVKAFAMGRLGHR